MWVPRDVIMTSASDVWVQGVRVTDMWGQVNGQYGLGLNRAGWAPGRAGLGRARPDTWQAVAQPRHGHGPLLGFVHSAAHTVWPTVDQRSWSMDLRQGAWWTKSTVSSPWLGSRALSLRTGGR